MASAVSDSSGSGSEGGESAMADFVDAFELDSDDGELPTVAPAAVPELQPEPEREPEPLAGPVSQSCVTEGQLVAPAALSEAEIYTALRAVAIDVNAGHFRSAAELERLVTGLSDWHSAGVQQRLWELCNECVQGPQSTIGDERSPDAQVQSGEDVNLEENDPNSGVIRVLSAVVNCIDSARYEVEAELLELLLHLKGAVCTARNSVRSSGSNTAIWRFDTVRMVPLPTSPWPPLDVANHHTTVSSSSRASKVATRSEMHVDLQELGGAEAMASIADALAAYGLCTCSGLLPAITAVRARTELDSASDQALFRTALKGSKADATPRDDVVLWLDPSNGLHRSNLPSLLEVEERLAQLGQGLSRVLRVSPGGDAVPLSGRSGAMAACYRDSGAQYRPHIDNPCGLGGQREADDGRRLTAIWYPNEDDWDIATDGAALRVWTTISKESPFARANPTSAAGTGVVDICPSGGTLALFWAHHTPHAVLPATGSRPRYAISVWFNE